MFPYTNDKQQKKLWLINYVYRLKSINTSLNKNKNPSNKNIKINISITMEARTILELILSCLFCW